MALFRRRRGGRHASRPAASAANPVGSQPAAPAVDSTTAPSAPPPAAPPGAAVGLILRDGTHFALAAEDPGAEPFRALVGELLGHRDPTGRA